MSLTTGSRIGPYEVLGKLGAGGMGEVFRARDDRLAREVAIKVLPAGLAGDPERRLRFEQEARATAALSHRNVLAIYDVGTHEGQPYLVEELLHGRSLRARLNEGALPVSEAVAVAAAIARGLAAAHQKGIVHRDLKPENVFLTADGEVKVLDFGLAKLLRPVSEGTLANATTMVEMTRLGAVLGTTGYMSPEQVCGQHVDQHTDIFAFGCVLYEMLCGRPAFARETVMDSVAAVLREDPPPLAGQGLEIPPALQAIVVRCLEKRPQARFDSAHDLALALEVFSGPSSASLASASRALSAAPPAQAGRRPLRLLRPVVSVPVALLLVLLALFGTKVYRHRAEVTWAREQGLPEIMRLAEQGEPWSAFLLARKVEALVPNEPLLGQLWPQIAADIVWRVEPEGAEVFARHPSEGGEQWIPLGRSGDQPLRTPMGCTVYRVAQQQSEPLLFAMSLTYSKGTLPLVLRATGDRWPEMARIDPPDRQTRDFPNIFDYGAGPLTPQIGSFLIDVHEVTNREFKQFVDGGGYRRRELWREEFRGDDGAILSWEEAQALFRDGTGRPGPATWELGTFAEGTADHPVTGVSWYEAAAYAESVGKRLPTSLHWQVAGGAQNGGCVVAGSNYSGELAPVGSFRGGLNVRGLYDMAGNAREWCSNAVGDRRVTRGGACNGPDYFFRDVDTRPPLERDPTTGFRCMVPLAPTTVPANLDQPLPPPRRWSGEQPFSDEIWKTWLQFVAYEKAPLAARVERVDESSPYWRMETVTFEAAYGGERMLAYLYLPRKTSPPYQSVVFWPGASVVRFSSSDGGRAIIDTGVWSYLVRDGRAVLYPVLKGTYDRGGGVKSSARKEEWVMQVKDISRSLDYLESREDIAKDRIGFLGFSWGAYMGTLACASDARFKAAVLRCGGLNSSLGADVLGWAHRLSLPVQMVNGRFDSLFPYEENSAVLFRALGTPEKDKRQILLPSDHQLSGQEREVMKVELEWFDRYLGPVRR